MAEIAISYSRLDDETAHAVRDELVRAGYAVWIDETRKYDDTASLNIPLGQQHWAIICREFAAAHLTLVIDTPNWHESRYCQKEHEFLLTWGKWVEFYVPGTGSPVPLAQQLSQRQRLTGAHARVVQLAHSGTLHSASLVERLLRRTEARDAEMLLDDDVTTAGITISDELGRAARDLVDAARKWRVRLLRALTALTLVLAVLVVFAVVEWTVSAARRDAAVRSANLAQSLNEASLAQEEADTAKALQLAGKAVSHADTAAAVDALGIARANDHRLRAIGIDRHAYRRAQWAAEAPIIVAYAGNSVQQFDATTGRQTAAIELNANHGNASLAVSASGDRAVIADGTLWILDFRANSVRQLTENVNLVATAEGEDLWTVSSHDAGVMLQRRSFDALESGAVSAAYRLSTEPKAMAIDSRHRTVDYLDGAGALRTVGYDGDQLREIATNEVLPAAEVDSKSTLFAITRCGESVYGNVPKRGIHDQKFRRTGQTLVTDAVPLAIRQPVCNPDGSAWAFYPASRETDTLFGTTRPFVPWGSNSYIPVCDPVGSRTAVVTPDGWLYIMPGERIEYADVGTVRALIRFPHNEFHINTDGEIVDTATGSVTGTLGTVRLLSTIATTLGDIAAISTDNAILRIDSHGRPLAPIPMDDTEIHSLRAGSDGQTFVVVDSRGVALLARDGTLRRIPNDWLQTDRRPIDADVSPDGRHLVVSDTGGRVALLDPDAASTPRVWPQSMPASSTLAVGYISSTANIVVLGADGIVRLLDHDLNTVASSYLGDTPQQLDLYGDTIVVTSARLGITLYDTQTLHIKDRIPRTVTRVYAFALDPASAELLGLQLPESDKPDAGTSRTRIPLPTLVNP